MALFNRNTYVNDGGSTRPKSTPVSYSTGQNYTTGNRGYTPSTATNNRTYTNPSTGNSYRADANAYVRNPTLTTAPDRGNTPSTPTYTPPTYTPTVSSGGGEVYSAPSYSEPAPAPSYVDDILNKLKSLMEEQKKQADEFRKTQYEQALASNRSAWENNRNQINMNYARTNRYLNNMYGDAISGSGLSNRARNYQNWNNNLAENQKNYTNNDATALATYNNGLANNASTLAQGWYNYILPIHTNRQQNLDDYEYNFKKYLASLNI